MLTVNIKAHVGYCLFEKRSWSPVERQLTLNANFSNPSEKPGRSWYRVPAFETRAKVVVGPAKSLLAILMPETSPVS